MIDFQRYGSLLNHVDDSTPDNERSPFVRVSESQRVIDTATNWTASLIASSGDRLSMSDPLIIPEDPSVSTKSQVSPCVSTDPNLNVLDLLSDKQHP